MISKIHLPPLILTCLWMSGQLLMKSLPWHFDFCNRRAEMFKITGIMHMWCMNVPLWVHVEETEFSVCFDRGIISALAFMVVPGLIQLNQVTSTQAKLEWLRGLQHCAACSIQLWVWALNLHQCLLTHLQVCGSKRLSCHAGPYTVSRCHARGESQDHSSEETYQCWI